MVWQKISLKNLQSLPMALLNYAYFLKGCGGSTDEIVIMLCFASAVTTMLDLYWRNIIGLFSYEQFTKYEGI